MILVVSGSRLRQRPRNDTRTGRRQVLVPTAILVGFLVGTLKVVTVNFSSRLASILRPRPVRPISLGQLLALAAGLAVPCFLMLTAIDITYRYRRVYPEIDLLAFLGFYVATSSEGSILHRYWVAQPLQRSSASYQRMPRCSFTNCRRLGRLNFICAMEYSLIIIQLCCARQGFCFSRTVRGRDNFAAFLAEAFLAGMGRRDDVG
jgi:hypothetical protein